MTGASTSVVGGPPASMTAFLVDSGIADRATPARWTPMTGGVSSDLWRVDLPDRTVCVKAALPTLRVADTWHAPVDRNAVEVAWLRFAAREAPGSVPRVLADDPAAGLFAMEFLDPAQHPVWKQELLAGRVFPDTAAAVGDLVGGLAAASTTQPDPTVLPVQFATDDNFRRLRIDPYFGTTAARRPEVDDRLHAIAVRTQQTRVALVHGDVSPKNILLGPAGPVLLDAECAWWGDPAFDVAFCLNHLVLKTRAGDHARRGVRAQRLNAAAMDLWASYIARVNWEPVDHLARRVADLLPALLLARIDGSSPVEYLTDTDRDLVRGVAVDLLRRDDHTDPRTVLAESITALAGN